MAISSQLNKGDLLQFPSHALRKIVRIDDHWITFGSLKDSKKRSVYSKSFVIAYCDLVPDGIDLQYFLNTTHDRRTAIDIKAVTIDAYSDQNVLTGYSIEDEVIDHPQEEENESL